MLKRYVLFQIYCFSVLFSPEIYAQQKPNVLIIYADDLGYGDVSAYKKGSLNTPNIDKLAAGGVRFTDGHSTSATCTPSRYALMSGVYPWRIKGANILDGDAPLILDTNAITLPKIFKNAGYTTAVVGKWHLGLGKGNIDWNKAIFPNPNSIGFDYSYIMAATNDRVPSVYIENQKVVGLSPNDPLFVSYKQNFEGEPSARTNPELLTKFKAKPQHLNSVHDGISRIGYMKGGKSALWVDAEMGLVFLEKAKTFIEKNAPKRTQKPFFLYYALHQPHAPRVPNRMFEGKSGMGPRGDVILEADWCVGEIMKKLEAEGLQENTLVIFSSDNGPVLNDEYFDDAVEKIGNHTPTGGMRGGKYSLLEAGNRVPFISYWKGTIKPSVSDALVCQIDFLASFAQLFKQNIPLIDSQNMMNVLLGKSVKGRAELITEAYGRLAFRKNNYSFIPPYKGEALMKNVNIESGILPKFQLYDLSKDFGQKTNIAPQNAKKVAKTIVSMKNIVGESAKINEKELD